MDYIVNVSGNIVDKCTKTYVISARNQKEALDIANKSFQQEYEFIDMNSSVKPYHRTIKAIIAFSFMFIAIILSCIEWQNGHDSVLIRPDYISTLYSILFYAGFVVRFKGIQRTTSSWIDVVAGIGVILLLSSFIQTMLFSGTLNVLGITEIKVDMKILLPIALVLSWVGLKLISIICMLIIGVIALFSITSLNEAMGALFGTIYILSAFLSTAFYLSIEPVMVESLAHIKTFAHNSLTHTKNDLIQTKKTLSKLSTKSSSADLLIDNSFDTDTEGDK